jgi:RluA family pseudouridine synthase
MSNTIKLSSPAVHEFWEIPVLYEDAHLLALDKPAGLAVSPDRLAPDRPSLLGLLHAAIAADKPWARDRGVTYLMNTHRLDAEASGVLLLAKSKAALVQTANVFGAGKPHLGYLALVQGTPASERFEDASKLAPRPARPGFVHVDPKGGKQARTLFEVRERFDGWTLIKCEPTPNRPHQVRVHLRHQALPVVGDDSYGGRPLWLSRLKTNYRLKPDHTERPLIAQPALHAETLALPHPVTGEPLNISAPWPKDLRVAVKYLQRYAPA